MLLLLLIMRSRISGCGWIQTGIKVQQKRGVRFYVFDGIWEKVFEILKTFNDDFKEIG